MKLNPAELPRDHRGHLLLLYSIFNAKNNSRMRLSHLVPSYGHNILCPWMLVRSHGAELNLSHRTKNEAGTGPTRKASCSAFQNTWVVQLSFSITFPCYISLFLLWHSSFMLINCSFQAHNLHFLSFWLLSHFLAQSFANVVIKLARCTTITDKIHKRSSSVRLHFLRLLHFLPFHPLFVPKPIILSLSMLLKNAQALLRPFQN